MTWEHAARESDRLRNSGAVAGFRASGQPPTSEDEPFAALAAGGPHARYEFRKNALV
jgi:hypothetical protein